MWLCFPQFRSDFDDGDEGNKLFRYICLSLFCQYAQGGSIWIVWGGYDIKQCFVCFSSGVMMKQQAPTMTKSALPGRRSEFGETDCVFACEWSMGATLIQHFPSCCYPYLFIFYFYTPFYFYSNFWAFVLAGWFYFQVFGRRSEFCR